MLAYLVCLIVSVMAHKNQMNARDERYRRLFG